MKLIEVDLRQEYRKSFGEKEDEETLKFIFSHGLFPQRLYYPEGAIMIGDSLFTLPDQVQKVSYLKKQGGCSLQEMSELFFGSDVLIKNQDEILEEKGELIMAEYGPYGDVTVERILSDLYPGKEYAYLAFDAVKMQGRTYEILLQVGFVRRNRMRIEDTLPALHDSILKEEKPIIYPLLEDIFKKLLFQVNHVYLN